MHISTKDDSKEIYFIFFLFFYKFKRISGIFKLKKGILEFGKIDEQQ
jgi:hypothetical protein